MMTVSRDGGRTGVLTLCSVCSLVHILLLLFIRCSKRRMTGVAAYFLHDLALTAFYRIV